MTQSTIRIDFKMKSKICYLENKEYLPEPQKGKHADKNNDNRFGKIIYRR